MIKYTILLNKVHRLLDKEDWPKKLVLEPKTFWDLIVALDGQLDDVDWHFEEESEGFPYIVLGPTMVTPVRFGRKNELKVEGSMEEVLSEPVPLIEETVTLIDNDTVVRDKFLKELDANESLDDEQKQHLRERVYEDVPMIEGSTEDERQEIEGIEAISVREAERVDEGRVLPESPSVETVHGDEDVPDDGPEADSDGSRWRHVGTDHGPPRG